MNKKLNFKEIIFILGITSFCLIVFSITIVILEVCGLFMLHVDIKIPLITTMDSWLFIVMVIFGFPMFIFILILYNKKIIKNLELK